MRVWFSTVSYHRMADHCGLYPLFFVDNAYWESNKSSMEWQTTILVLSRLVNSKLGLKATCAAGATEAGSCIEGLNTPGNAARPWDLGAVKPLPSPYGLRHAHGCGGGGHD